VLFRSVGKELEPILRQPLPILPNGTDVAFWKALPLDHRPGEPLRLVSVMRFGPRKRGASLVRIFARFISRLPPGSRPAHLTIIGDGRLRWQIQLIIFRLGLKSEATLTGFLPRAAIREVFQHADIFILPGRVESFGISALEARSAGLPTVVHAEGGAQAFIRQEREGLLAGTEEEMAACLLRLATDEELRRAIADHNRATWPDFDWSRVVTLHEDMYRRTIENHGHH
jgi:glycosyltransferase involved in cell wall biosynthesis